jgi:superfamily II DNA or RNA helicase
MRDFRLRHPNALFVIVVPTLALLDQWFIALQEELGLKESDIALFSGEERSDSPRTVNLFVLNTARGIASILPDTSDRVCRLLIVDECHRAATPANAAALEGNYAATLGLSATPEREYDAGFEQYLQRLIGEVFFVYDYAAAHADHVITTFDLINVGVSLSAKETVAYDTLTRRISAEARLLSKGEGDELRLSRLLQRRARVSANAQQRVPVAIRIVENHKGTRTVVFHESVAMANTIAELLRGRDHSVTIYHSRINRAVRRENLRLFRRGVFDVLVCCRALDEGMNVPEISVAVVASSTASLRQRVQRLGRVLRPAPNKDHALVYTLYATETERTRLAAEAATLDEFAEVRWQRAS